MTIEVRNTESGVSWVNATGLSIPEIDSRVEKVGREIANWVSQTRGAARPSLFNRAAYVAPDNPYALMRTAKSAVENDDVLGGVCDVTEGLMLQGVKWESGNAEDTDIFNQLSRDLNLDEFVRAWHREEFTYSQVVVGLWWGRKTYTVRGHTTVDDKDAPAEMGPDGVTPLPPKKKKGPKRKKKYTIATPVATTFLNPLKVVPLTPGPFGQDRLAWHATDEEYASAIAAQDNALLDPVMAEFTTGPVTISKSEQEYLGSIGIDYKRLLGLNPASVFRFSRTKMSYERFPPLRLKSVFPILDLKQQLMEADRVSLVGAANFILLVRQGSKEEPALQAELDNLQENFKVVAKLPVVIGDHRLSIDIITPDQDQTLAGEKYDTLDRRILSRTLGALTIATGGQRNESTLTVARGVGRLLENRRHMMKRALEEQIARPIVDHPQNAGLFEDEPNLTFTPRNVQLDSDGEIVRAILALRQSNELSRESTLEYFGFDQAIEALRREFEEESGYDDIFKTQVPFSAANGAPPAVSGQAGGRPKGGGESKKSVNSQVKPRTGKGNPSTT